MDVRPAVDNEPVVVSVPPSGVDLDGIERALIVYVLDAANGNRTRSAKLLRLTRSALLYRMQKYGLNPKRP